MGPLDKRKMNIKRDLKQQKTEVTKAKKIAETLLLRLQEAQERIDKADMALDTIPANVFDSAMSAISKKKDLSNIKSRLELLAQRVATKPGTHKFLAQSLKPVRLPVGRIQPQTRGVRRVTIRPATAKPKGRIPKPQTVPAAPIPASTKEMPLGPRPASITGPTSVVRPASISRPASVSHPSSTRISFTLPRVAPRQTPPTDDEESDESDDDNKEE